jgi:hypothetical protein
MHLRGNPERSIANSVRSHQDAVEIGVLGDPLQFGDPAHIHVGFLQPTRQGVDRIHEALSARHYGAPKPAKLQRGGPATYGFYCEAPGGVLVEVSTMNVAETA